MDLDELFSEVDKFGLDAVTYQYFNQLFNHRTIVFNDDVSDDVVERIFIPLKNFEEDNSTEPVTLILNSSGGSVSDGFFLAHYISTYKKPLTILVTGYACSMATVLLAGGGKNPNITRVVFPCSYALIHDGYVALASSESKTAADIMAFNDRVDENIKKFFTEHTNITAEMYDNHSRHQWFIFADEMITLGLADKLYGE